MGNANYYADAAYFVPKPAPTDSKDTETFPEAVIRVERSTEAFVRKSNDLAMQSSREKRGQ